MLSIEEEKQLKKTLGITGQCLNAIQFSLELIRGHISEDDDPEVELFDAEVLLRKAGDPLWELHKSIDRKLTNAEKKRKPASRRKLQLLPKEVEPIDSKLG